MHDLPLDYWKKISRLSVLLPFSILLSSALLHRILSLHLGLSIILRKQHQPGMSGQVYNPSNPGGRDQRIPSSRPVQETQGDPFSKINKYKRKEKRNQSRRMNSTLPRVVLFETVKLVQIRKGQTNCSIFLHISQEHDSQKY